ncbi:hypothetical protein HKD37_13G038563 [Glycine soja]
MIGKDVISMHLSVDPIMILDKTKLIHDKSMINSDSRFEQKKLLAKLNLIAIKKTVSKHLLSGLPEKRALRLGVSFPSVSYSFYRPKQEWWFNHTLSTTLGFLVGLLRANYQIAKEFSDALGKRYQVSDNAKSKCLMKQLTNIRYDNVRGVREFIMKMVHIQTKLKYHQIDLNEKFIVKHGLKSLPANLHKLKLLTIPLVRNGL